MDREVVSIAISAASVIISYFLARHSGDVAGTNAAIAYEREKASKARIAALRALLNEIEVIRGLAQQNSEISPTESSQTVVLEMPLQHFRPPFSPQSLICSTIGMPNLNNSWCPLRLILQGHTPSTLRGTTISHRLASSAHQCRAYGERMLRTESRKSPVTCLRL